MVKRIFDYIVALTGIVLFGWLILICILLAAIDTRSNGIFSQIRIGRYGKPFRIYKIRTIRENTKESSALGKFFRKSKLDELPQLWNVLTGKMSMVGPRPDIPGYYDLLTGEDREVLQLRPGITGPASLKYADEEKLLALQEDKEKYNDEVIFPDKVRINLAYLKKQNLLLDIKIIILTIIGGKITKGNLH